MPTRIDDVLEPEFVEITFAEFKRLCDREAKLEILEAHGVDNWEGYDEAMEAYDLPTHRVETYKPKPRPAGETRQKIRDAVTNISERETNRVRRAGR